MRACPHCEATGLYEHSVLVPLQMVQQASSRADIPSYLTCADCASSFLCSSPDSLQPVTPEDFGALGQMLWMIPPWVVESIEADFEMSWDLVQDFFRTLDHDPHASHPVLELVANLREAGYGSRLRAGQSLTTLVLSRARRHELRAEQSYLEIAGRPDGLIGVRGNVGEVSVHRDEIAPGVDGWLDAQLQHLAAEPID